MSRPHKGPSATDWENQKSVIEPLYYDKTLDEVIREMDGKGFRATVAMYKRKFSEWGWKKNISQEAAREAFNKRKRDTEEGTMSSGVYQNGRPVKSKRLDRHWKNLGLDAGSRAGSRAPPVHDMHECENHQSSSVIHLHPPEPSSLLAGEAIQSQDSAHLDTQLSGQTTIQVDTQGAYDDVTKKIRSDNTKHQSNFTATSSALPLLEQPTASPNIAKSSPTPRRPEVQSPAHCEFDQNTFDWLENTLVDFHHGGTGPLYSPGLVFASQSPSLASRVITPPPATKTRRRQAIHQAALNGRTATLELILKSAPECYDVQGPSGETPLFLAASGGHYAILEILLKAGAAPDLPNTKGWRPIHQAAHKGHLDCVNSLIHAGGTTNDADADGWTPLMLACHRGHNDIVKVILASTPNLDVNCSLPKLSNGRPIHLAAQRNHLQTVGLLIQHKALVNAEDDDGITALWLACKYGHTEVAELLLTSGADWTKPRLSNQRWPIHQAVQGGHAETVRALIAAGAEVNQAGENDWTPLFLAAQEGHLSIAELLIQNGADVNLPASSGETALLIAARCGHLEVASILVSKGASVEACTKMNRRPVHQAAEHGHLEIVKLLADHGADIACQGTMDGGDIVTPLLLASGAGHDAIVKFLIERKAPILI